MHPASGVLVRDIATAGAKAAPAAAVTLYALVSKGLPLLVGVLTAIYVALQAAHLIWKWRREAKTGRLSGDEL